MFKYEIFFEHVQTKNTIKLQRQRIESSPRGWQCLKVTDSSWIDNTSIYDGLLKIISGWPLGKILFRKNDDELEQDAREVLESLSMELFKNCADVVLKA